MLLCFQPGWLYSLSSLMLCPNPEHTLPTSLIHISPLPPGPTRTHLLYQSLSPFCASCQPALSAGMEGRVQFAEMAGLGLNPGFTLCPLWDATKELIPFPRAAGSITQTRRLKSGGHKRSLHLSRNCHPHKQLVCTLPLSSLPGTEVNLKLPPLQHTEQWQTSWDFVGAQSTLDG